MSEEKQLGPFSAKCPNEHHPSQHDPKKLHKKLADTGELEFWCRDCNTFWSATEEQKERLRNYVGC